MSKFCQKCNAEMADNMNFCPQCRTKYIGSSQPMKNKKSISNGNVMSLEKRVSLISIAVVFCQLSLFSIGFFQIVDLGYLEISDRTFFISDIITIGLPVIIIAIMSILHSIIARNNNPMPWGDPRNLTPKMWVRLIATLILGIGLVFIINYELHNIFL